MSLCLELGACRAWLGTPPPAVWFRQITRPLWALTPSLKLRLKMTPPALWELGRNVTCGREAPCPGEPTMPPGTWVSEQTGLSR